MQSNWKSTGEKLHKRNIEVTTYDYDEQRIIVEGLLRDDYFHESHMLSGGTIPSGVTHHMAIRLLVNCSNLLIEDCDVDLIAVPREACLETRECLAFIKGLTITKGFTLKIKKMAGGNKGCAHLVELLMAMSPAIFQGFVAHQTRKPLVFDSDQSRKLYQLLLNTCHPWREDGPFVERYKKNLLMEQTKIAQNIQKSC